MVMADCEQPSPEATLFAYLPVVMAAAGSKSVFLSRRQLKSLQGTETLLFYSYKLLLTRNSPKTWHIGTEKVELLKYPNEVRTMSAAICENVEIWKCGNGKFEVSGIT